MPGTIASSAGSPLAPPVGPGNGYRRQWRPATTAVRSRDIRWRAGGGHPVLDWTKGVAPRLTITCTTVGPGWVLVLRGSLDVESVIALHSQFEQLLIGEFDHVIVDIDGLTAIDHAGASALSALGERVSIVGAELRLR